jgi:hypothetical protein
MLSYFNHISVLLIHIFWDNYYFHSFTLLVTNYSFSIPYILLFIILVGVINQFRLFKSEHPLPVKYHFLFAMISSIRLIPFLISTYWLLFTVLVNYCILYEDGVSDIGTLFYSFVYFLPLYLVLSVYTFTKATYTPFLRGYLARNYFQRLNELSSDYQLKNSGRVIYKPEGVARETKMYQVEPHFKDGCLFHGLDSQDNPIYTDFKKSMDGHFSIIGGTGAGKGVLTRMYLAQVIKEDVSVFVFDPKPDNFMYDACFTFAEDNGKKMHVIDLDEEVAQISIFAGVGKKEFTNIFLSALELNSQKGTNARVYAERAERAIYGIAKDIYEEGITPVDLYKRISNSTYVEEETIANLFFYLQECQVFNAKNGLSFLDLVNSGDVVFIRCSDSKENDVARVNTQILFTSFFQRVGRRDQNTAKQCMCVIDEFKFIMNSTIMNNLATIRDQKCSLVFNFQDISNFTTSPNKALHKPEYAQELISNSHFVAMHNASEIRLIELIQSRCGRREYDKPMEEDISDVEGASKTSTDRRWTKHVEYNLTKDEIATGGKRTAILLSSLIDGDGYARIHTHFVDTRSYTFKISG